MNRGALRGPTERSSDGVAPTQTAFGPFLAGAFPIQCTTTAPGERGYGSSATSSPVWTMPGCTVEP